MCRERTIWTERKPECHASARISNNPRRRTNHKSLRKAASRQVSHCARRSEDIQQRSSASPGLQMEECWPLVPLITPFASGMCRWGKLCEPLKAILNRSLTWPGPRMEECWPLVLLMTPSASGMDRQDRLWAPLKAILEILIAWPDYRMDTFWLL